MLELAEAGRRALERDEKAIQLVEETWLEVNNAASKQAWIVFQEESGLSLLPVI